MIRIGTAGWAIPRRFIDRFPAEGSNLQRYASRFAAAEINSTFYRSHQPQTFERWAAAVHDKFRFAVKLPRTITHEHRLADADALLDRFLNEVAVLGTKLGPLLVQLPPGLVFDADAAGRFLGCLRDRFDGLVACEPRHASWFEIEADGVLRRENVARVVADPARVPQAAEPGGWPGLIYFRLHGSPRMYFSDYDSAFLVCVERRLRAAAGAEVWCVFDNTASGAATGNALALEESIGPREQVD